MSKKRVPSASGNTLAAYGVRMEYRAEVLATEKKLLLDDFASHRQWVIKELAKKNDRITELEAENERLLGSVEVSQEALKNQREQAGAESERRRTDCATPCEDFINAEVELERVKLKLIFMEEWFENILPTDYDLCMERWAERSTP